MGASLECMVLTPRAAELKKFMPTLQQEDASSEITAAISGRIVSVRVSAGDKVSKGQTLLVMEAMKMENVLTASRDGIVSSVMVKENDIVSAGDNLLSFED